MHYEGDQENLRKRGWKEKWESKVESGSLFGGSFNLCEECMREAEDGIVDPVAPDEPAG